MGISTDGEGDGGAPGRVDDAGIREQVLRAGIEQLWSARREYSERGNAVRIHWGHQDVTGFEGVVHAFDRVLHMPESTYRLNTAQRAAPLQHDSRIRVKLLTTRRSS